MSSETNFAGQTIRGENIRRENNTRRIKYGWKNGAGDRSRTYDLLITNQLLYQLSYASTRERPYSSTNNGKCNATFRALANHPCEFAASGCANRAFKPVTPLAVGRLYPRFCHFARPHRRPPEHHAEPNRGRTRPSESSTIEARPTRHP